jgi:hypothetical protein
MEDEGERSVPWQEIDLDSPSRLNLAHHAPHCDDRRQAEENRQNPFRAGRTEPRNDDLQQRANQKGTWRQQNEGSLVYGRHQYLPLR